jgi:hypothetical protein
MHDVETWEAYSRVCLLASAKIFMGLEEEKSGASSNARASSTLPLDVF